MRLRVLIVDDEPDMLDYLERVLRQRYDVTRATGAAEALAAAGLEDFCAVVTDHRMPNMSGLELAQELRTQAPAMVRILLSGYSDLPEVRALRGDLLHDCVVKPVDSQGLLDAVSRALERYSTG